MEDIKKAVRAFLFGGTSFVLDEPDVAARVLGDTLAQEPKAAVQMQRVIELIMAIYESKGVRFNDSARAAARFLKDLRNLYAVKAFAGDSFMRGALKNAVMSDIVELIRFAYLQKKNLGGSVVYNRHLEKVLGDMNDAVAVLCELGADSDEISPVLEKCFEFTCNLNTPKVWVEFYKLSRYAAFGEYIAKKENLIIGMFEAGSLNEESLRPFFSSSDSRAAASLKSVYEELLTEDPPRAAEIKRSGLLEL